MRNPHVDTLFDYRVDFNTIVAKCRLRIFHTGLGTMVIFKEIAENPGASVTNAIEKLIQAVSKDRGLDIEETIWIEMYDGTSGLDPRRKPTFDRVRLDGNTPRWEHMPAEMIEQLLGSEILSEGQNPTTMGGL